MINKRIISLLPSATEIVVAIGAGSNLVGISHECDHPQEIKNLPVCSKANVDSTLSSAEIDAAVKNKIENALSLYELDFDLIKSLNADLIITQDQCKVCAVHVDDMKQKLIDILGREIEIISLQPSSIEDVLGDIQRIADSLSINVDEYLEELNDRIEIVKHKVKFVKHRPEIVCIEWMEPLMTAGHWTPQLIDYAGGKSLLSEAFKTSKYISWEELQAADPDGIIIAACGFDMEKIKSEMHSLEKNEIWQNLKAVQKGHVFIADGNAYFNRSGPRLVDTLEIIAEILQVNQFYYGFENIAWEQLAKNS